MAIEPYTQDLIPNVKAFSSRLKAAGAQDWYRIPEKNTPGWWPRVDGGNIYQEYFLAVENGFVRGFYSLIHRDFSFRGETGPVGYFLYPISEGTVDSKFAWVAPQMLGSALKARPLLLTNPGLSGVFLEMLKALGWSIEPVPFYFKVNRPARFLREMRSFRSTRVRRLMTDIAAATGLGSLALTTLQTARSKRGRSNSRAEVVQSFSSWADDLWNDCKGRYGMIALRDSQALNILYPLGSERVLRYRVYQGDNVLGWAVLSVRQMQDDLQFGNMVVGSIVDCLALPENALAVIRTVTRVLEERGVDLIVANHRHASWCTALQEAGFLERPSHRLMGMSVELAKLLPSRGIETSQVYFTRGDGEGPILV
jgi:hypothetical protein